MFGKEKKRLALIRELMSERMRHQGLGAVFGPEIARLDKVQLYGCPEGTLVTIVDTYILSKKSGAPDEAILDHIENHRSQVGGDLNGKEEIRLVRLKIV